MPSSSKRQAIGDAAVLYSREREDLKVASSSERQAVGDTAISHSGSRECKCQSREQWMKLLAAGGTCSEGRSTTCKL